MGVVVEREFVNAWRASSEKGVKSTQDQVGFRILFFKMTVTGSVFWASVVGINRVQLPKKLQRNIFHTGHKRTFWKPKFFMADGPNATVNRLE